MCWLIRPNLEYSNSLVGPSSDRTHNRNLLSYKITILVLNFQNFNLFCRYPPHGRRTIVIEEGVQWERLRAPPLDTPAHDLHISDCLNDLQPGDHIEIQWRRNKEFPYGTFVRL